MHLRSFRRAHVGNSVVCTTTTTRPRAAVGTDTRDVELILMGDYDTIAENKRVGRAARSIRLVLSYVIFVLLLGVGTAINFGLTIAKLYGDPVGSGGFGFLRRYAQC